MSSRIRILSRENIERIRSNYLIGSMEQLVEELILNSKYFVAAWRQSFVVRSKYIDTKSHVVRTKSHTFRHFGDLPFQLSVNCLHCVSRHRRQSYQHLHRGGVQCQASGRSSDGQWARDEVRGNAARWSTIRYSINSNFVSTTTCVAVAGTHLTHSPHTCM